MTAQQLAEHSVWMDTPVPKFAPLPSSIDTDVCVIGAGIAGLTVAYSLLLEGHSIVVIDQGEIGSGETSRSTAHATAVLDDRFHDLERLHGAEKTRLAAQSHAAAIAFLERLSREGIDCDFERLDGYLLFPESGSGPRLEEELEAVRRASLEVERVARAPLKGFDSGECLRFPAQSQLHPRKYLAAISRRIAERGGQIFTGSHVVSIESSHAQSATTATGHTVRAGSLIVATNSPINDFVTMHTKQAAYRTYAVGFAIEGEDSPRMLLWDTEDPYHYVRVARAGDARYLIVGGEDHKTGQANDATDRFARLEAWAWERFPAARETAFRWSGQIMEPVDSLGFIGRNPGDEHIYIVTGDSGNGITHGLIAGMLIPDLIHSRENPWQKIYDPARMTVRAAARFARENLNVAAQFKEYATGGELASVEEIPADSGAIVRRGLKKIAVYRDASGQLIERSAVCTHLGCVVAWNAFEKSWDCPCHGSRFDTQGSVLNGPARAPLARDEGEHAQPGSRPTHYGNTAESERNAQR